MAYRKKEKIIADLPNGPRKSLTAKQQAFALHFVATRNGAEAVKLAGYQCKPGNENRLSVELRNHPTIAAFIQAEMDKLAAKAEITATYVLDKLVKIVDNTEVDNPQAALRGLELIGKHLGMYRDKTEISGPDGEAIQTEQKVKQDVAEFTSAIARLAKRGGEDVVLEFPQPSRDIKT